MLAYDYPILGVFWTLFMWFIWIAWFVLLFRVIADIFRSSDLGGWGKALWALFVIIVPFLGVFVYVVARGHSMSDRDVQQAKQSEAAFQSYIRESAGTGTGAAQELTQLADLRDKGVITAVEFEQQKTKLLK